jgi:hypothetical protein
MSDLTEAQLWLVRVMAEYQFGRIDNLGVKNGQPAPDERLKITRYLHFGQHDAPKVPLSDDPELKRSVWELFNEIENVLDGSIACLEFRHGLPFLLEVIATPSDALQGNFVCRKAGRI